MTVKAIRLSARTTRPKRTGACDPQILAMTKAPAMAMTKASRGPAQRRNGVCPGPRVQIRATATEAATPSTIAAAIGQFGVHRIRGAMACIACAMPSAEMTDSGADAASANQVSLSPPLSSSTDAMLTTTSPTPKIVTDCQRVDRLPTSHTRPIQRAAIARTRKPVPTRMPQRASLGFRPCTDEALFSRLPRPSPPPSADPEMKAR